MRMQILPNLYRTGEGLAVAAGNISGRQSILHLGYRDAADFLPGDEA